MFALDLFRTLNPMIRHYRWLIVCDVVTAWPKRGEEARAGERKGS